MSKTVKEIKEWLLQPGINKVILVNTQLGKYFSNKPYISNTGINYIPCIKGGVSFTETLSFTANPSTSFGDLELDNTSGILDDIINSATPWKNSSINMYIGDSSWPVEDFSLIFSGIVTDILIRDRRSINLSIGNLLSRLNVPVTEKVIQNDKGVPSSLTEELLGVDDYPHTTPIIEGLEDQLVPVLVGECFNVTPKLVSESYLVYNDWVDDLLPDGQVFILNDKPIERIIEVRDNGIPLKKGDQWDQIGTKSFALYTSSYGTITCSAQGYIGSNAYIGEGIGEATSYAETIASVIQIFLTEYGGENKLSLSDLSFPIPDNTPYTGYYCTNRENVLDICNKIATSGGYQLVATTVTVTEEDAPSEPGKVRLIQIEEPGRLDSAYDTEIPVGEVDVSSFSNVRIFNYTGNVQLFTIPANVNYMYVELLGASGGGPESSTSGARVRRTRTSDKGGVGGEIKSWIPVTPGDKIKIIVGGKGKGGVSNYSAGGGGGFSAILTNSDEWIISAGGGGGGTAYSATPIVTSGVADIDGGHTLIVGSSSPPEGGAGGTARMFYDEVLDEYLSFNGYTGTATGGGSPNGTIGSANSGGGGGGYGYESSAAGLPDGYLEEEYYGGVGGWPGGGAGGVGHPMSIYPNTKGLGGGGGGGGYVGGAGGNNDELDTITYGTKMPGQGGWNFVANNNSDRRIVSIPGQFGRTGGDGRVILRYNTPRLNSSSVLSPTLSARGGYIYDYEMTPYSLKVVEVFPPKYSFNYGYCKNWTPQNKNSLGEALVPQAVPLFTTDYLEYKIIDNTSYTGSNSWLAYLSKVPPRTDSLLNNYDEMKIIAGRMKRLWDTQRYFVSFTLLPHHLYLQLGEKLGIKILSDNRFPFLNNRIGTIVQIQRNWLSGFITVGVLL